MRSWAQRCSESRLHLRSQGGGAGSGYGALTATCIGVLTLLVTVAQSAPSAAEGSGELAVLEEVQVREYRFRGNTVFSDEELASVVSEFSGRTVTSEDLEEARRKLTRHYVEHGYFNSGAVLEDQPVVDGAIMFTIIEGVLAAEAIEITGNHRLRSGFLRSRLARHGRPLNVWEIQNQLLLLDQNPNIDRLNAELQPGEVRGTSRLNVSVKEAQPYSLGVQVDNERPSSVGEMSLSVVAAHHNVLGFSDSIDLWYGVLEQTDDDVAFSGLDNLGVSYEIPFTARDTTLMLAYRRQDYVQIEEPFLDLDIESESERFTVGLVQPWVQRPSLTVKLGLLAERLESRSFLLGQPFSFSPGAVDGESLVSVVRFYQEWTHRTENQVFAARATFSFGLDVFETTDDGTSLDGRFSKVVGQAQYLRRLDRRGDEIVLRATGQWADDPLLSLEQLAIGGFHTVRGYRENEIVRDTGLLLSAEARLPVLQRSSGANLLAVVPFIDYGRGWNVGRATPDPSDLAGAGVGVVFTPSDKLHADLYWGYGFRKVEHAEHGPLQDNGLHFHVQFQLF